MVSMETLMNLITCFFDCTISQDEYRMIILSGNPRQTIRPVLIRFSLRVGFD
jgi:hypothetical protein